MNKDRNKFFMQEAFKQAKKALQINEVPIGAVVVFENKIIGEGFNQSIKNSDPTAHAEIIAINAAGNKKKNYRLVDCDLFVTLEPCMMCLGAIMHARIKNVYFATSDHKKGVCGGLIDLTLNKSLNHHCNFYEVLLGDESKNLLQQFFQEKRTKRNRA
jgi:tRNA(adenine34) deaminase